MYFRNVKGEDTGKYRLHIVESYIGNDKMTVNSFDLIVEDKPSDTIDCKDMTVYEGDNVTCVCNATRGYNPVTVKWTHSTEPVQENSGLNNLTGVLRLENISRNQSGIYACFDESQNLVNKRSFNIKEVHRRPPKKLK